MKNRFRETFKSDSSYRALFASIVTFALSFGLYKGIIDNYLAEVAGMSEFDKGVSEFFRELPGLGIILVLAVFYTASAAKLYQIGTVIMLAGMAMQAVIPSTKVLVIMAIFIWTVIRTNRQPFVLHRCFVMHTLMPPQTNHIKDLTRFWLPVILQPAVMQKSINCSTK